MAKLRTILLYETNYNMNNMYIRKDMTSTVEKTLLLAKDQYGSRKRKKASLHVLN